METARANAISNKNIMQMLCIFETFQSCWKTVRFFYFEEFFFDSGQKRTRQRIRCGHVLTDRYHVSARPIIISHGGLV